MTFGVHLSYTAHNELACRLLSFFLDPLVVLFSKFRKVLECLNVGLMLCSVLVHLETIRPVALVEVEEHLLLALVLSVVNCDRVVVLVEAVLELVVGGARNMADVRGSLSRFCPHQNGLLVNAAESINHNLSFHGLNGIEDDCGCSWI